MIMVEKPRVPGMNGRSLAISVTYCESCSSPSRGFLAVRLASSEPFHRLLEQAAKQAFDVLDRRICRYSAPS